MNGRFEHGDLETLSVRQASVTNHTFVKYFGAGVSFQELTLKIT